MDHAGAGVARPSPGSNVGETTARTQVARPRIRGLQETFRRNLRAAGDQRQGMGGIRVSEEERLSFSLYYGCQNLEPTGEESSSTSYNRGDGVSFPGTYVLAEEPEGRITSGVDDRHVASLSLGCGLSRCWGMATRWRITEVNEANMGSLERSRVVTPVFRSVRASSNKGPLEFQRPAQACQILLF